MTKSWMLAALLCTALVAACADRTVEDERDFQEPESGEPAAPAPSATPDSPAARQDTPATRTPAVPAQPPAAQTPRGTTGATAREITLPAGTALPLELVTALSSETTKVEAPVRARLLQAVMVDDVVVLPAGTVLTGTVLESQRSGRVQGRARLSFSFDTAQVGNSREQLRTNPIVFEAQGTVGEDAAKVGAGAAGGAIIGGILGGGSGAARGAAIGGAAGAGVVLATRGEEVELAEGVNLAATLAEPYQTTIRVQ